MEILAHPDPTWTPLADEQGPVAQPTPRAHALLTLEQWLFARGDWPAALPIGLMVPNTVDVALLAPDLPRISLLVLQFPKWTDGRAYSQARLLRGRHRFIGDLRACGEVLVDMMPLLQRTGFSSAQLRADQSIEVARRALQYFSAHYQGDLIEPAPLFNRKAA